MRNAALLPQRDRGLKILCRGPGDGGVTDETRSHSGVRSTIGPGGAILNPPSVSTKLGAVPFLSRGGRFHMLGSEPDPDQPGGEPAQERETREKPEKERWCDLLRASQDTPDEPVLDQQLEPLDEAGRPPGPPPAPAPVPGRQPTPPYGPGAA